LEIALKEVDDVKKNSKKISIDGVSQKLTTLKIGLSEETVLKMALAVMEEAKDDKDLKKALLPLLDYLAEEMDMDEDGDELYEMMQEAIDEGAEAMDDLVDDADDEEIVTITDYVNNNHEVVGRTIEVAGQEYFTYVTVRKGNKVASKIEVYGQEVLAGSGTEKKGILNAEYSVTIEEETLVNITVEDFNTDLLEKDMIINGTFTLRPTAKLYEMANLDSSISSVINTVDPALQIVCDGSKEKSTAAINLLSGNKVFVGISLDSSSEEPSNVKVPTNTTTDTNAWASNMDLGMLSGVLGDLLPFGPMVEQSTATLPDYTFDYDYSEDYIDFGTGTVTQDFGTGTVLQPEISVDIDGFQGEYTFY
jgi:hypothetical protein